MNSKQKAAEKTRVSEKTSEEELKKVIGSYNLNSKNLQTLIHRLEQAEGGKNRAVSTYSLPQRSVTFLIVGDLHMNSRDMHQKPECDLKRFNKVLDLGKEMGAEYIIQTGDVTDGENMRGFQKYGLIVQGFENVLEYCVNEWPNCGLPTFFIGGNHDESYLKTVQADICKHIAKERSDLHYLGMNEGEIPLQPEYQKLILEGKKLPEDARPTIIRVRHPGGGSAKGKSYKQQQHIAALLDEKRRKPNILIVGHYHKMDYLFEKNVHVYQAGTMQRQSDWMRTLDLQAYLGGVLVTVHYHKDGTISHLEDTVLESEINGKV